MTSKLNDCYSYVGFDKASTSSCDRVPRLELKDQCYKTVAVRIKDHTLCGQIQNEYDKNYCLTNAKTPPPVPSKL
jgi:hypothetical protein